MKTSAHLLSVGLLVSLGGCIETRYDTGASGEDSRVVTYDVPEFATAPSVARPAPVTATAILPAPAPAVLAPPPPPPAPVVTAAAAPPRPVIPVPPITIAPPAPAPAQVNVQPPLSASAVAVDIPMPKPAMSIAALPEVVTPKAAPQPLPQAVASVPSAPAAPRPTVQPERHAEGFAALRGGRVKRAESYFVQALRDAPNDPYALLAMGAIHEQTGREFDATTYYVYAEKYGTSAPLGTAQALDGITGSTVAQAAAAKVKQLRSGG